MDWWGLIDNARFLDRFTVIPELAYSLRQLRAGVTNVARVRRSNDNTELDFTASHITDGTLLSWVGAGNGFVTTLYQQSVNRPTLHATQTVPTNQPQLVANGALVMTNGRPAMRFNGTGTRLGIPVGSGVTMNNFNVIVVCKSDITTAGLGFALADPNRIYVPSVNGNAMNVGYAGSSAAFTFGSVGITNQVLLQLNANAAQANAWRNGVASTPVASSSAVDLLGDANLSIGAAFKASAGGAGTNYWNGTFQEVIFYTSTQTALVAAHAAAINSYYNIY